MADRLEGNKDGVEQRVIDIIAQVPQKTLRTLGYVKPKQILNPRGQGNCQPRKGRLNYQTAFTSLTNPNRYNVGS